jgi:hypothetical protein
MQKKTTYRVIIGSWDISKYVRSVTLEDEGKRGFMSLIDAHTAIFFKTKYQRKGLLQLLASFDQIRPPIFISEGETIKTYGASRLNIKERHLKITNVSKFEVQYQQFRDMAERIQPMVAPLAAWRPQPREIFLPRPVAHEAIQWEFQNFRPEFRLRDGIEADED